MAAAWACVVLIAVWELGGAHVLRGLESTVPSSVTMPTATLFAEPSMPRTYTMRAAFLGSILK